MKLIKFPLEVIELVVMFQGEGVQRDLLPLIEGTTVNTKYGPVKTDHILFIASGAFQLANTI